jgi:hypothetical protein
MTSWIDAFTRPITVNFYYVVPHTWYYQKLNWIELVYLHTALLMFDFHAGNIPEYFSDFFTSANKIHQYNTRLASCSSYSLPRVQTIYGKFNIRFNSASIWNSIDESVKDLSKIKFKKCLISKILDKYLISNSILFQLPFVLCNWYSNSTNIFFLYFSLYNNLYFLQSVMIIYVIILYSS